MAKRPSIACCVIAKNEAENLPRWFESIKDCFDEINLIDTGSTDNTVGIAKSLGINVSNFTWVHDFAAARNFAFEQATTDYIFWNDLDDVLTNREAFIEWRDTAMRFCDIWLATYDYASDDQGNPVVSFVRERVVKRGVGEWKYFIHEGFVPKEGLNFTNQYAVTWKVTHKRSIKDIEKDKSRNINIFKKHEENLDARMKFYYGKELFENKQPLEAFPKLMDACADPKLAHHDRILAIQYACYAAIDCNQIERAVVLAHQGLQLAPQRAEFHSMIGDCYVKQNRIADSVPWYHAAKSCLQQGMSGDVYAGAVFNYKPLYTVHPRLNLSKALYQLGNFTEARKEAQECYDLYKEEEAKKVVEEIDKAISMTTVSEFLDQTDDIIISTPPHGAYEWDSKLYKERHMGGSETAAIEVSQWLRRLTGRNVIIYNQRELPYVDECGVEYRPVKDLLNYTSKKIPYRHIAWRHNNKLTKAPTYLWCHDLVTQGCELDQNFDKMICLSEFHKNYVSSMQGISKDKIVLTKNGIRPERFNSLHTVEKNPVKVMFPSSPDRGLQWAMLIMDRVREVIPNAELHVFYGVERLDQYGMKDLRVMLEAMFAERPWVKYHGGVEQKVLAEHFMQSAVWLYPATFIESQCISALEAMASHCYPVVRDLGALPWTLKPAIDREMADCLDVDPTTEEGREIWSKHVVDAIIHTKWKNMDFSPDQFSWESVTKEFIDFMQIQSTGVDV